MESVSSNTTPSPTHRSPQSSSNVNQSPRHWSPESSNTNQSPRHRSPFRYKLFQPPIADRIVRAFRHRLRLLHRSSTNFFVLGDSGNVYKVNLTATPSCTCPDRTTPCKHILFVFLRVLGVSLEDTCLRRRTLRPCQLSRLLGSPTSPDSLAGIRVRERFHELFLHSATPGVPSGVADLEDGATCPICLDELGKEDGVVTCRACRNPLHEECLQTWKRSRGRRPATCVICRARWRDMAEQERYLNLAAYVCEDDAVESHGNLCVD
ncbi:mitogen-activated protein kinase kinase kinase 1-like [Macadamia integrifolia]|uniref:mitogen-activated protein kinase kinase kinase 1-like n=1 Tax=Macadamia integrifolia TaxID=60698 RepID=UPI001C4E90FD|nr:mitogen-activated protein kinase kinase kinase 1-like [Macadamia integrifolia]